MIPIDEEKGKKNSKSREYKEGRELKAHIFRVVRNNTAKIMREK